jgi:hypothetical protein
VVRDRRRRIRGAKGRGNREEEDKEKYIKIVRT